jgi:hypothetical protein
MAMFKDVFEEEADVSHVPKLSPLDDINHPSDPLEVELLISLNALMGFFAPQTLKLIGYIKNQKFIILVDIVNIHNFIHRCNAQEVNCYIRPINNFQIMITNGGSMKCGWRCENVCLQIGQYHLKYHIFLLTWVVVTLYLVRNRYTLSSLSLWISIN